VYTPEGKKHLGDFALDVAGNLTHSFHSLHSTLPLSLTLHSHKFHHIPLSAPHSSYSQFTRFTLVKTLSYFTEYFGIPYPLPKLDMVAIADFAAGAMEYA
jgi:hypothetical protein